MAREILIKRIFVSRAVALTPLPESAAKKNGPGGNRGRQVYPRSGDQLRR